MSESIKAERQFLNVSTDSALLVSKPLVTEPVIQEYPIGIKEQNSILIAKLPLGSKVQVLATLQSGQQRFYFVATDCPKNLIGFLSKDQKDITNLTGWIKADHVLK